MKRILVVVVLWAGPALAADIPALYQKHCAACHGARGEGGTATPAIAGMPANAVAKVVRNHPPPMEKTGMNGEEVTAMGKYVAGLKR